MNLGGSGRNSANHAAHERLDAAFGIKTTYIPYKGTGDMATAVVGGQIDGAMTYTPFAIANKARSGPLAVAMEHRHPLMPDVPTFKELGVDWVDGAYRGIGVPKSTSPEARKRLSNLWRGAEQRPRDEGTGGQERLRAGQRRRGPDGRLHEGAHPLYTEGARGSAWGRSSGSPGPLRPDEAHNALWRMTP